MKRALFIDEEARQLRDIEFIARASSSRVYEAERGTTNGGAVAKDTTEDVPTIEGASSGQPDPPSC